MTDAMRVCVGVDVAKATLDVQVRPPDAHWGVANEDGGIRRWSNGCASSRRRRS